MKHTEARVGNWVYAPTNPEDLSDTFPHQIIDIEKSGEFVFEIPEIRLFKAHAKNCAGILLTREWLILNGFQYTKNDNSFCIEDIKLQVRVANYFSVIFPGIDEMRRNIKYIHEFQNVYHELNGEEFNVKMSPYI